MAMKSARMQDLTSEPGSGSKETNEKVGRVIDNGHARRRLYRDKQIPFRCTPADRALLIRLSDALNCSFTTTLARGLHALDREMKAKRGGQQ